jgi:hypothetical protein
MLAEVGRNCTDNLAAPTPPLSEEHRRELEAASSPDVIRARGCWTAERVADVPEVFPRWQRRRGLVFQSHSPDRVTRTFQLKPRKPIRRKSGDGPKYETPQGASITLDVNPLMLEEVRSGTSELWVSEGFKKIDALASWGIPAVGGTGVHMFAMPGTKGTVPLPCWQHVRLKDRTVIIAFDADAKTNADVQEALRRLVAMLEKLGAMVLVVYVPPVNGDSKAGVDDYKGVGGSRQELRLLARPFEPVDIARERMSQDEKLTAVVSTCWQRFKEMPARKRADCSKLAAMRDLISTGERTGKVTPEGLLVIRSSLDGAVGARMSERAWWKSIERLEAAGELRRVKWGPAKDRPGAYLLTPWGGGSAERAHYGKGVTGGEGEGEGGEENRPQSFPLSYRPDDRRVHETRGVAAPEVPVLRWPKVVHTWAWREGRRVVVDSDYIARIGKQGEEVMRYLLDHGSATVTELLEEFGSKTARARDFRRRRLVPLMDRGIVAVVGEDVCLTPAWREALEQARAEGEEPEDNRLQAEKAERRKLVRREYFAALRRGEVPKAERTPELRGKAVTREILERHRPQWAREEAEKLRRMVRPAAQFARDILERQDYVRLGLLEEMWSERGGLKRHLRIALREIGCKAKRHAEHPGELFVYQPKETREAQRPEVPAAVVPVQQSAEEDPPPGDWRKHPLTCECMECAAAPPAYATARGMA